MLPFKITRRNAAPATPRAEVSSPIPTSPAIPVSLEQKPVGKKLINIPLKRKTLCDVPIGSTTSTYDVIGSNILSHKSRIFIIGGVEIGGSKQFIDDFLYMFPEALRITDPTIFSKATFNVNDILLIQHLVTGITIPMILHAYKTYKCRIIISIHDYYYFSNNYDSVHNAYLRTNIRILPTVISLFSIAELVIHPSQFTYDNYSKYFSTSNFIVCPHIDFAIKTSELAIPRIVNNTINIGAMHRESEGKGHEYVTYLSKTANKYKGFNINFIIVGKTISEYNYNEFFDIIKKHNIHCLLSLNKWGETYCYALSKYLKSGLPILFNSVGALGERIPSNPQYMAVFDREVSFDNTKKCLLISRFNQMLDFIIENKKHIVSPNIDLSLTIPELYKQIFSARYMIDPLSVKNVVLLSSAIVVSNIPLSYTDIRSVASPHTRYSQTVKNINIIRYKVPNVAIILIDPTDIPEPWKTYLRSIVDIYENCSDDPTIATMTNTCFNKGAAECAQLIKGLDHVHTFHNAKTIFKISGRYYLSKSFNISAFDTEKVCFKLIPTNSIFYEKTPACFTFLFSVPVCFYDHFKKALQKCIIKASANIASSIETILPFEFDENIIQADTLLGVSGFVGPTNIFLDDIK